METQAGSRGAAGIERAPLEWEQAKASLKELVREAQRWILGETGVTGDSRRMSVNAFDDPARPGRKGSVTGRHIDYCLKGERVMKPEKYAEWLDEMVEMKVLPEHERARLGEAYRSTWWDHRAAEVAYERVLSVAGTATATAPRPHGKQSASGYYRARPERWTPGRYQLIKTEVRSGYRTRPKAVVWLTRPDGTRSKGEAASNGELVHGGIDAGRQAMEKAAGRPIEATFNFAQVRDVGSSEVAEVSATLHSDGRVFTGFGRYTDTVGATARALVDALNKELEARD